MISRQPDISIITINFNGFKDTCELIESLETNIKSVSYEIIVVDNASLKNEYILLKEKYPNITVIHSESNKGFSGGNNLGIRQANGRYILLLNNDTFIKEDTLQYLIETLDTKKDAGGISPKIKFASSSHPIQFAGYTPLSSITLRNNLIGINEEDTGQYQRITQTPYTHGAAMMIKKEVIEKVGLMPEIYFLYYEELDWCTQMTNKGYTLWYDPRCTVYHKESQSTGQDSYLKIYYLTRNRLLYTWRNRKGLIKWMALVYQITVASTKNCLIYLAKKRIDLVKATIKGNITFITLKHKRNGLDSNS